MAAPARRLTFHGAFTDKAAAVAREREVGGFIRSMMIAGQRRYAVLTRRNPRASLTWPRGLKTFASLERARVHAQSIRSDQGAFIGRLSNGRYGVTTFPEARRRGWV